MNTELKIWVISWIETDGIGNYSPILEVYLKHEIEIKRKSEIENLNEDEFSEFRGYPTALVGDISISTFILSLQR